MLKHYQNLSQLPCNDFSAFLEEKKKRNLTFFEKFMPSFSHHGKKSVLLLSCNILLPQNIELGFNIIMQYYEPGFDVWLWNIKPPLNIERCGFNILWPWYIEPPSAFHLLLEKGAQNIRLHWYYLFEKLIFNSKYVTHTSWFNLHVVVPSFVLTFWYNLNHQSLIISNCYWIFFKRPKYFFKVEITDYFCEVKRIWCSELLK